MCNHKCQCCGPCCCCKDHVETAFILGLAYIICNVLFFEMLPFGIADDNYFTLMYIIACKIFHPFQHAVLIFAAHKRSSTAILAWIILTAIICSLHVILGKITYLPTQGCPPYLDIRLFRGQIYQPIASDLFIISSNLLQNKIITTDGRENLQSYLQGNIQ